MIEVQEKYCETVGERAVESSNEESDCPRILGPRDLGGWRACLMEELNRSAVRKKLALGLVGVACIHLGTFCLCQAIYDPEVQRDLRHLVLWVVELILVLVFLSKSLGRGWIRSSSAVNLVAKLWTTFLILSFNLVTLNSLTGFQLHWYKPVWATLSTFFFATLGWLFSPWFLVPAVQMWVTGLLMMTFLDWAFLIYGVSWWLALSGIAILVRRNELVTQE
jgi:hypothetical protein